MRTQSPDTPFDVEKVQVELLRRATTARRFGLARSLSQTTIQLARRAIRRSRPCASEEEVDLAFVALHYGPDLAERLRQYPARRQ